MLGAARTKLHKQVEAHDTISVSSLASPVARKRPPHQQEQTSPLATNVQTHNEAPSPTSSTSSLVAKMKATQSRISSQNAVHAILPHSEPRVASPTPSTTSVRSIKSIRSTANSVAPSVAGTEASQKSWLDEAADNESSIAAGSIVSSIEGGSIEGSIPNSRTSSKASKRREPTDPSDYNAVTVNLMHASRLRQWDASSDPFAVVTVGTAGTSFDDKMDVLEEIGRHDCLWESE